MKPLIDILLEAIDITKNENFKRWFGKSKIKKQSKPLVVFHGTTHGTFSEFQPRYRKNEQLGFGIHFTATEAFATKYAEDPNIARKGKNPKVYFVYLKVEQPLYANVIVDEGTKEYELAKKLAGSRFFFHTNPESGKKQIYMQHYIDMTSPQRAEKLIKEAGYDGVVYESKILEKGVYGTRITDSSISYIVFSPTQIKSATDNNGNFDPNNPDITK